MYHINDIVYLKDELIDNNTYTKQAYKIVYKKNMKYGKTVYGLKTVVNDSWVDGVFHEDDFMEVMHKSI